MTLLNEAGEAVEDIPRPLDHVSYEGNTIFVDGSGGYNDEGQGNQGAKEELRARLAGKYDAEKFHRHVCGVLSWFGRRSQFQSLQIDKADEDFANACEVVHRRAITGMVERVLERMASETAEDIVVCLVGFGPVALAVADEAKDKRLAKKAAAQSGQSGGKENDETEPNH